MVEGVDVTKELRSTDPNPVADSRPWTRFSHDPLLHQPGSPLRRNSSGSRLPVDPTDLLGEFVSLEEFTAFMTGELSDRNGLQAT
jgi:hypothetical protein